MAKPILRLKIDVTKIDKSHLFKGEKGTYLDVTLMENDQVDEYGNAGFVFQSVSKEAREAGVKGPIIGNYKTIDLKRKPAAQPAKQQQHNPDIAEDSIPF